MATMENLHPWLEKRPKIIAHQKYHEIRRCIPMSPPQVRICHRSLNVLQFLVGLHRHVQGHPRLRIGKVLQPQNEGIM